MKVLIIAAAALSVAGCALAPSRASLEIEHTSHILQHFGPHPTNYGFQSVGLAAHWRLSRRVYLDLSDGIAFGSCSRGFGDRSDLFQARAGWIFWRR